MAKKSSFTAPDPEEFSSERERAEYLETKVRYLEALLEITGYDPNDPVKKKILSDPQGQKSAPRNANNGAVPYCAGIAKRLLQVPESQC